MIKPKKLKVLSLFDGISCARVALEKLGYDVEYYASEVDKYAIKIAQANYPDTVQLGDVKEINQLTNVSPNSTSGWPLYRLEIDLLIGGSPCQDLSAANYNRKGLAGKKSGLFYEYLRILKEVQPKYWILENVNSMAAEARDEISKELGVEPIKINAGLVSAQSRNRLFWTNIPNIDLPKDLGLVLKDIMEPRGGVDITERIKAKKLGTLAYKKAHANTRTPEQKANALTARGQDISNTGSTNILLPDGTYRKPTPIECERLQGLPDDYTKIVSDRQRYKATGNAFNVEVIKHIISKATWK